MKDTILFDLDGTLIDTSPGIIKANMIAIEECGFKCPDHSILQKFIGPPLLYSYERYLNATGEAADNILRRFRELYDDDLIRNSIPYDGIEKLLDELRNDGYNLCVATYKPKESADFILDYFDLAKYFHVIHGSNPSGSIDKAGIIKLCIKEVASEKDKAVMIGDSVFDSDAAKQADVDFIAVTYGFGFETKEEILKIENVGVANDVAEIKDCIKRL